MEVVTNVLWEFWGRRCHVENEKRNDKLGPALKENPKDRFRAGRLVANAYLKFNLMYNTRGRDYFWSA